MLCLVLNVENVIQDDIVDEDSCKDANDDENTGLWEYLGQKWKVMEDDLEHDGRDDEASEHDGTGEL